LGIIKKERAFTSETVIYVRTIARLTLYIAIIANKLGISEFSLAALGNTGTIIQES
jgi:hypothetical protein